MRQSARTLIAAIASTLKPWQANTNNNNYWSNCIEAINRFRRVVFIP